MQPDLAKQWQGSPKYWVSGIALILGCVGIARTGGPSNANHLSLFWLSVSLMGAGFFLATLESTIQLFSLKSPQATETRQSRERRSLSLTQFWGIAIVSRAILLPLQANSDMWRYLWEGYVQLHGFSPYHLPPSAPELTALHTEWWWRINNLDTSAIYPPLTQLGFASLATISTSAFLFKAAFVLADLGICWLLLRRFGPTRTLLYAWNPMILVSFAAEGHYDSWFILPLVVAWLTWDQSTRPSPHQFRQSAIFIGISMAVKWVSLPILGFIIWRSLWQRGKLQAFILILWGILPLILTAIPYCYGHTGFGNTCPLIPTSSEFVTHGRIAEFVPYFVEQVWDASRWSNWLFAIPLGLAALWLIIRLRHLNAFTESYFFILLLFSPVIHAWYFTWLIPFAVKSRNLGSWWVSLSSFTYFVLLFNPDHNWYLPLKERLILWLPLIFGGLVTLIIQRNMQDKELELP